MKGRTLLDHPITRYATVHLVDQLSEDVQRLLWAILDDFVSETENLTIYTSLNFNSVPFWYCNAKDHTSSRSSSYEP